MEPAMRSVAILGRIVLIQSVYYVLLCLVMLFLRYLSQIPMITLDYLFYPDALHPDTLSLDPPILIYGISFIFTPFLIATVVHRPQLCLDHIVTLHILHIVLCMLYGGLRWSFLWLVYTLGHLFALTLLTEFITLGNFQFMLQGFGGS